MKINTRLFLLLCFASMLTILLSLRTSQTFRIVFCDVGQGAATIFQLGSYQALIDTGPDKRILNCIGRHLPFFDHTIETIIISHNQKDHVGGLAAIQDKYTVLHVYGPPAKLKYIDKSPFTVIDDQMTLHIDTSIIIIKKASRSSKDINDTANVVTIKTPIHTIFLASDINGVALKGLLPQETTILQVPHHGSKYGLYPDSLDLADLSLAVISVGKKNGYGHPSSEVLDILKAEKIRTWRTDEQGELIIDLH